MSPLKKLSYQAQIFLISVILIAVPSIVITTISVNRILNQVDSRYQESLLDLTPQNKMIIDSMISNAEKIGTLHIVNDEVRKILTTDYSDSPSSYYSADQIMKAQLLQANQLNTNVISSIFINQYGYKFDYNFNTYSDFRDIFDNIEEWAEYARNDLDMTYVAPICHPKRENIAYQNILPLVTILRDPYTFLEIGVMGVGINFNSVTDILSSSKLPNSTIILFDQKDQAIFSTDSRYLSDKDSRLIETLSEVSAKVDAKHLSSYQDIQYAGDTFSVNTLYNSSTGWKIVHILDNTIIAEASNMSIQNLIIIFIFIAFLELVLAYFISHQLSKSINHICYQIDQCEDGKISLVSSDNQLLVNREMNRIVDSYNRLNQRLMESMHENYLIQLNEKQMELRMLQAQINPHFFYNTLNVISSIANIRNVPEIRTISTAISELLRYNLKSGSIVTLKQEVEQVARYITIQQIRFPDKFIYECALPPELEEVAIPVSSLQPLIENTIVHGFAKKEEAGYIMVNIYGELDRLHILIADNGTGIEPQKLETLQRSLQTPKVIKISDSSNFSIGLLNVHQRIQSYYGKQYGISIDSTLNKGTIVDINLPLPETEK